MQETNTRTAPLPLRHRPHPLAPPHVAPQEAERADVVVLRALPRKLRRREDGAVRPEQSHDHHGHAGDESQHANHRERAMCEVLFRVAAHQHIHAQEASPVAELHARKSLEDDIGDGDVKGVSEEERGARGIFRHKGDTATCARPPDGAGEKADRDDADRDAESGTELSEVVLADDTAERRPALDVQARDCEEPEHGLELVRPVVTTSAPHQRRKIFLRAPRPYFVAARTI